MQFYQSLKFLPRYAYKFFFIAFIGIHVPLIGTAIWVGSTEAEALSKYNTIILILVLTLAATACTLYAFHLLLSPVHAVTKSIKKYRLNGEVSPVKIAGNDEVSYLIEETNLLINDLDKRIQDEAFLTKLLSHDLRSPASQIFSMTEMLMSGNRDHFDLDESLLLIAAQARHQLSSLGNVLLYLQHTDNRFKLSKDWLDVEELFEELKELTLYRAKFKNITVEFEESSISMIFGDRQLIVQALQNLIINSLKFSNRFGKVILSIHETEKWIAFRITDNGIGFNKEMQSRLFDVFTSSGRSGTNNEKSVGLGLSLVKSIAELHEGEIVATSEGDDKGACFELRLPRYNQ